MSWRMGGRNGGYNDRVVGFDVCGCRSGYILRRGISV